MSFFVSTPVGRILNRFSKDTAVTDNVLVRQVLDIVLVGCLSLHSGILARHCLPHNCGYGVPRNALGGPVPTACRFRGYLLSEKTHYRFSTLRRPLPLSHQFAVRGLSLESTHNPGVRARRVAPPALRRRSRLKQRKGLLQLLLLLPLAGSLDRPVDCGLLLWLSGCFLLRSSFCSLLHGGWSQQHLLADQYFPILCENSFGGLKFAGKRGTNAGVLTTPRGASSFASFRSKARRVA